MRLLFKKMVNILLYLDENVTIFMDLAKIM